VWSRRNTTSPANSASPIRGKWSAKTLVVSLCILVIIYYLVIRHINRIVSYAQKLSLDRLAVELTLEGRPLPRKHPDEFDALAATLNQMRTRLNDEFTARHQAADQLQQERDFSATLINSANMVICCMEPDLNIASINPAAILLTGYHHEELLQHNWLDLFVSQEQRAELAAILSDQGSLDDREIIMHDQQGHELVLQWTFAPFYEGPNLKYLIGFGYDITRLKKVEREITLFNEQLEGKVVERTRSLSDANDQLGKAYDDLKQAQQTLVESEKMASLGSLVAGVAHEINTPIGISVTASSYLQEQVADFKQHLEAKQLSRSYLNEFTQNLDESMQLLQGNLRRASELIASFKQVAVDQSSEARYNFTVSTAGTGPRRSPSGWSSRVTSWSSITVTTAAASPQKYCRASSIPSSLPSGARGGAGSAPTSSTTWWCSCSVAASIAPANRAREPSSIFACPSSRTERRLL